MRREERDESASRHDRKPPDRPAMGGGDASLWRRKGCLGALAGVFFFALVGLVLLLTRGDGDQTAIVATGSTTIPATTTAQPSTTTKATTTTVVTTSKPVPGSVTSESDEIVAVVRFIHEEGVHAEPGSGATYDKDTLQIVDDHLPEDLAQLDVFFAKVNGDPWVLVGKPGARLELDLDGLYAEGDGYIDSIQVPGVDLVPAGREPLPWFSPRFYPDTAVGIPAAGVSYLLFSLGMNPDQPVEQLGLFVYSVGQNTFQAVEWRVPAGLHDIPIIGDLFHMDRTVGGDTGLILVLTPNINVGDG